MDGVFSEGKFSPGCGPADTNEPLPQISVVVPVYKAEKYLRECAESVLRQTFKNFELILVNDGSPDKSGEICDEIAKQDPRIRVFHKENKGATAARKFGIEEAKAEWVCLIDSDDILLENALEDLFSATEKFGDEVDIVEGSYVRFRKTMKTGVREIFDEARVAQSFMASGLEYALGIVSPDVSFSCAPWPKIIRKNLFAETRALDLPGWIIVREDTIMNLLVAKKVRTAVRIPSLVYNYRIAETGTFFNPKNQDTIRSVPYNLSLLRFLEDSYVEMEDHWEKVVRLFLPSMLNVRDSVRRCDFSVLKDPAYKEILAIQKEEFPEIPTKLFIARYSFPWKFVPNSVFKAIFMVVREACRPFGQIQKHIHSSKFSRIRSRS